MSKWSSADHRVNDNLPSGESSDSFGLSFSSVCVIYGICLSKTDVRRNGVVVTTYDKLLDDCRLTLLVGEARWLGVPLDADSSEFANCRANMNFLILLFNIRFDGRRDMSASSGGPSPWPWSKLSAFCAFCVVMWWNWALKVYLGRLSERTWQHSCDERTIGLPTRGHAHFVCFIKQGVVSWKLPGFGAKWQKRIESMPP